MKGYSAESCGLFLFFQKFSDITWQNIVVWQPSMEGWMQSTLGHHVGHHHHLFFFKSFPVLWLLSHVMLCKNRHRMKWIRYKAGLCQTSVASHLVHHSHKLRIDSFSVTFIWWVSSLLDNYLLQQYFKCSMPYCGISGNVPESCCYRIFHGRLGIRIVSVKIETLKTWMHLAWSQWALL